MISAFRFLGLSACSMLAIAGCSRSSNAGAGSSGTSLGAEKVLNIYNWSDFIEPSVIFDFEQEYRIKINYDVFDSNEQLETKLLVGHSNYDVVASAGSFLEREIKAGLYQRLDKTLLTNLKNLDPEAVRGMAQFDPGNQYAVAYMWLTTTGIGYDIGKIRARLPGAPVASWRMLFDPAIVAKFQDCGVSVLDSPVDVLSSALFFLGKNPNSEAPDDLKAVEQVLMSIRPYVRLVDSTRYYYALANGEVCLVMGWSGDVTLARNRAREAGNGVEIAYSIPEEGTISIFDTFAIPVDAPHPGNAHLFLNYLLRPEVAAKNSNKIKYATPVMTAGALLDSDLRNDPGVYPPPQVQARLSVLRARSEAFGRLLNRTWTRFKTGR